MMNLDKTILFYLWGFPINQTIFYTWIVMAILVGMSLYISRKIKDTIEQTIQSLEEMN